ncbi:MAG: hypothetical protein WD995_00560 [Gemmatimonadota bacterium]
MARSALVVVALALLLATAGCAQSAGSGDGVRSVATTPRVTGNPGSGHSDAQSLTVGVQEAMLRRTLGDRRISTYLSCGRDMTGDLADRATIRLWMVTRLLPSMEGGTQIRTELTANATDNDGTSRTVRPCSSNHRLEMGLAQHVAEAIGSGG